MKTTTSKMSILVLAAFLAGTVPAFAQKQTPPEGTPPKPFTVPVNETYTLPNGMKVTLVPYGIIPKAAISVAVDAGNVNEGKNRVGVADLTGELFKEGTVMLTAQELAQETGAMGSTLNVVVGADQSKLELDVLQEFAPQAVRLLADVVEHPRLPESELARLKNDSLRKIAVQTSQPQTIAAMHFRKILYGDHPYGTLLPTPDDVKKLTIQDVKDYYASNFGAQRTHLYVAGKFDTAAVKKIHPGKLRQLAKRPFTH